MQLLGLYLKECSDPDRSQEMFQLKLHTPWISRFMIGMLTFTKFSEKGRPFTTASCARLTLAAATSFMASVIFCVFLMELIRSRVSLSPAHTCGKGHYI